MNELTIYYSIQNNGDGSASPVFFETEELAEWHQEHLLEGWGEPCTGTIVVEGDNMSCDELGNPIECYLDLVFEDEDEAQAHEFKAKFFPDGLPELTVRMIVDPHYYGVFVGECLVYKQFAYPENKANAKGLKKFEKELQKLSE